MMNPLKKNTYANDIMERKKRKYVVDVDAKKILRMGRSSIYRIGKRANIKMGKMSRSSIYRTGKRSNVKMCQSSIYRIGKRSNIKMGRSSVYRIGKRADRDNLKTGFKEETQIESL